MAEKVIEVVGGPNGSGKTSFAESFLLRTSKKLVFLNPDIIASGISTLDFEKASFQAGRVLLSEIKRRFSRGESFAFESTLSGRTYAKLLERAKAGGYKIKIYFLFLDRVTKNLSRIEGRVKLGGHNIPRDAIYRRHAKCFENFWTLYRPVCSSWYIFDNSQRLPKLQMTKDVFHNLPPGAQSQFLTRFESFGRIDG